MKTPHINVEENVTDIYNTVDACNMYGYSGGDDAVLMEKPSKSAFLKLSISKYQSPGATYKWSCPSIATISVVLFILLVFFVLPIVYLLHCFNLLNSQWRYYEFNKIVIDHNHRNPLRPSSNTLKHTHISTHQEHNSAKECDSVEHAFRFDCFPEEGATESLCEARGCCWRPANENNTAKQQKLNVPYCFYPENFNGFSLLNVTHSKSGFIAYMNRTRPSPYPNDAKVLKLDVRIMSDSLLHFKIFNPQEVRFEAPLPEIPLLHKFSPNPQYEVLFNENNATFAIIRKSTKQKIFETCFGRNLVFADQFLQMSAILPSHNVYGLGEHRSTFKLSTDWELFTFFNHDAEPTENKNLYGSHPFYLLMETGGQSHGVFLLNSNAMDVILQPAPAITFRPIGGVFDFYVFMGPSPSDVIKQYSNVIGKPFMPPYWGLGFHLCRFGYGDLETTEKILLRNINAGIPVDVQWNDLDYMDKSNDFTFNKEKFANLPRFVNDLHKRGMHYIPLIDPGISAGELPGTYPPYDDGIKSDIFVKNESGMPFIGKVWNRISTVWPDFTNPNTVGYWIKQLRSFHIKVPFDGAWIDMNEPSNFYSGTKNGCPNNTYENPPYLPGVDGGNLFYKTLCMSSKQYAGKHYDIHNLYGLTEAIATNFALSEIRGKRPFIISRSTFSGHGRYAGHWSGDIQSSWYDMQKTIPELLSFSLFGIPLMGADICGFNGNTTVALCQRWSQLGAFYPFSRNHNTDDALPQDPASLGDVVVQSARKSLLTRYTLLPYLYSLFWRAHVEGETVSRPIYFEFPNDAATYDIDTAFLWGQSLMIIPVLQEKAISVTAYIPEGKWYDWYTLAAIPASKMNYTLNAPEDTIPLLIRGGYILPTQSPNLTTTESRKNKIDLIVASDDSGMASGYLYWDDGDTLNTYENGFYTLMNFTLHNSSLNGRILSYGYKEPLILGKVIVAGIKNLISSLFVNDVPKNFSYDSVNQVLKSDDLDVFMNETFLVNWK